jgi:hypothetical protein
MGCITFSGIFRPSLPNVAPSPALYGLVRLGFFMAMNDVYEHLPASLSLLIIPFAWAV